MSTLRPLSPFEKVCAISMQGPARTAIVTLVEAAFKAGGSLVALQGISSLGGAFRNWGRMESLFFLPASAVQWHQGKDWQYHKLSSVSFGLYSSTDLARWGLRHAQVTIKGSPIEGALDLIEHVGCLGIFVSSALGITQDIEHIKAGAPAPTGQGSNPEAYRRRCQLQIAMKSCDIAEVALKLIAQQFKWYKTADLCVRVASAVFCLMHLWSSPGAFAGTGGLFGGDDGGGDDGLKKPQKPSHTEARPVRPPSTATTTETAAQPPSGEESADGDLGGSTVVVPPGGVSEGED